MKNTSKRKARPTTPYALPNWTHTFYEYINTKKFITLNIRQYNVGDVVQIIVQGKVSNYLITRM